MYTPLFEPINLDAMTDDPSDYEQVANILRQYAEYCRLKALAIRYRMAEKINHAIVVESLLEKDYKNICEDYRW